MNGEQLVGTTIWGGPERHMKRCAQSVMKVNLSLQVVKSTVAAAVNTLVTFGEDNYIVSLNDTWAYRQCCYMLLLFVIIEKTM